MRLTQDHTGRIGVKQGLGGLEPMFARSVCKAKAGFGIKHLSYEVKEKVCCMQKASVRAVQHCHAVFTLAGLVVECCISLWLPF